MELTGISKATMQLSMVSVAQQCEVAEEECKPFQEHARFRHATPLAIRTTSQAHSRGMPSFFPTICFRVHQQFSCHRFSRARWLACVCVVITAQRQCCFACAHVLANRLNVEVFVAAGTDFGVADRDRDAELFGAPAAVLGDALGIELAVTVRTFFNLIVRM